MIESFIAGEMGGKRMVTIPQPPPRVTAEREAEVRERVRKCEDCALRAHLPTRPRPSHPRALHGAPAGESVVTILYPGPQAPRMLIGILDQAKIKGVAWVPTVACPTEPQPDQPARRSLHPRPVRVEEMLTCAPNWQGGLEVAATRWVVLVGGRVSQLWVDWPITKLHGAVGVWDVGGKVGRRIVMAVQHPDSLVAKKSRVEKVTGVGQMVDQFRMLKEHLNDPLALIGRFCAECRSENVVNIDGRGLGWCREHMKVKVGVKMKMNQEKLF